MNTKLVPFKEVTLYCGEMTTTMRGTLLDADLVELETCIAGEVVQITRGTFANQMLRSDLWYSRVQAMGFKPGFNSEYRSDKN